MTYSDDGSLRVWNLKTGAWRDGENGVLAIALSLDGRKVVCGCSDGAVKLWDIDTGKIIAEWTGHTKAVISVCWNQDCERVVSASTDGTARVWDVESGKLVLAIKTGLRELRAVVYSPDMTMIATGGVNREKKEFIKIWDAKTGKLIVNLKGHTERVHLPSLDCRRKHARLWSRDDSIRTWNTTTWQQILVLTGHTNTVCRIAISPNGPVLASTSWDDTVQLWNLEDGQPIGSPLEHPNSVECVSFSTDGKLLATGSWDHDAYSWDISGILKGAGVLNLTADAHDVVATGAGMSIEYPRDFSTMHLIILTPHHLSLKLMLRTLLRDPEVMTWKMDMMIYTTTSSSLLIHPFIRYRLSPPP